MSASRQTLSVTSLLRLLRPCFVLIENVLQAKPDGVLNQYTIQKPSQRPRILWFQYDPQRGTQTDKLERMQWYPPSVSLADSVSIYDICAHHLCSSPRITIMNSPKASFRSVLEISIPRLENMISLSFSWRRLLRHSRKRRSFYGGEVYIADNSSSVSSVMLVGSPTDETCTSTKMVRFDSSPTYFYTKHRIKTPKSPAKKSVLCSCLVKPDPSAETVSDDVNDASVYEDRLSTYPGFF
ncbi:hypothetical protein AZE42_08032 [Rhizopogon vesiculosus]|uniref:Uncharacterized protein n=1 Tax=Rhizopogon vesiculosus TaxID=180088 RepID=A0A1J8PSJ2_9AGAM|nr:hypothetical protein AZE42_08032 [Rhizopogon vesiculosus]